MAKLKRITDGEGFVGSRSEAIKFNDKGLFEKIVSSKPTIGCSMLVGTVTASSYSSRDYWITTEVTEILEEKDEYIRFKTKNSEYEWWGN
jgi:hypothetical protein